MNVGQNNLGPRLHGLARWKAAAALRAARNAARELDWLTAAGRYRTYLRYAPEDARAWIQYGHALKEAGQLAEAENAYGQAMRLDSSDVDLPLHLGHLLRRMGPERDREGAAMITAVARSRPPTGGMLNELLVTGNGVDIAKLVSERPAGLPAGAIFIELQDLFQYLSLHTTVTGITRVTLSLINYVLHEMPSSAAARYHFVHQYGDSQGVMLVDKDYMLRIVRAAMHEQPDIGAMQALIAEIRDRSRVFRLAAGDTYLIVGAFWEFVANPGWLAGMRYRGVRVGSYIYDLIPITYAQYCMRELTDAFTLAFSETARLLDFAMTISAFVADEVVEYLDAHGIPRFPVEPVLLAHELRFEDRSVPAGGGRAISAATREYLSGIPFVLCVCTIEARKNHIYLVTIWQRMIDAGIAVPDLVFVGRPGWRVESLMADIVDSDYLGGRLHILNGLADDELESLYDRCLFTVFPSFVEGWGLPVGESLTYGKVCVASSTSSVPEVGGDHALYVDPFDIDDGYAVISDLILDPRKLAEEEAKLRQSFRPRTWNDVGRDFFATTERLLDSLSDPADRKLFAPLLPPSRLFETKRASRTALRGGPYIANPERLAFVSGWRGVEATGTWMLDQTASFRLQTDCVTEEVAILLHFSTSPWVDTSNILSISVPRSSLDEPSYQRPMAKEQDFWIRLIGHTDAEGVLTIRLHIAGPIRTPEGMFEPLALRMHAAGYAPRKEPEAQIALLERALLSR